MTVSSSELRAQVAPQIEAIRLIITRLYDSTTGSAGLVQETQNELGLLLGVLGNIEQQSVQCHDHASPKLWSKLEDCYCCLLELKNLQKLTGQSSLETPFLEMRARLSNMIFEFSVINADMAMYVGPHYSDGKPSLILISFSDPLTPILSDCYKLIFVSSERESGIYKL
jgi:hypothetical protein